MDLRSLAERPSFAHMERCMVPFENGQAVGGIVCMKSDRSS